ncbi:MAG TPA: sterol desaturase family protein [Leptospiraceae bacterium]|nr:sterol desaturase family protein [Leptospiraceae bacterium]HMW04679.1 sterol desaturase family protein [Leptospiraceae bacterium]HMX35216.1 sterol desaturase family protein [Leptospiraceae bacterium]HMY30515.1 sterol desaturase family protein [Leptospiraceae bacterium]HMZ66281.1 sterol desaturase family protein [Leptospiraceae bacterium]
MNYLQISLEIFAIPFKNIILTTGRLYWIYILSALLISFFYLFIREIIQGNFQIREFLKKIHFTNWKTKSSLTDYLYYFIETILHTIFFSHLIISSLATSIFIFTILNEYGGEYRLAASLWVEILYTVLYLLAYDFSRFYIHKKMHDLSFLWEFHKFHHSATSLNYFTVYRVHPVESILLNSGSGIATGIVTGVFVYFYPSITMFQVLGVNLGLFLFQLYGNLRHSETWISFPSFLNFILLSPASHQIHHSKDPKHYNKNMGVIFAFWDRIADTLYIPQEKEKIQFGLPDENASDYRNLFFIFFKPFYKIVLTFVRYIEKINRLPPINTDKKYDRS